MLGEEIRKYLDDHGIKYSFVADSIGVHKAVFTSMLSGKRKITAEEYFSICSTINLDPNIFYEKLKEAG